MLPSFYDNLPQSRSSRNATSRRDEANQDKLNTDIFELYMEYVVPFSLISLVGFLKKLYILITATTFCTGIFGSTLMKTRKVLMRTLILYGLTCITAGIIYPMS